MSAKHTPGPWQHAHRRVEDGMYHTQVFDKDGETIASVAWFPVDAGNGVTRTCRQENARLIAAAPELLSLIEDEYACLADIHHNWAGRDTMAGQRRLSRLRDLICKATGREQQDVQDDYTNRNARGAQ